MPEYFLFDIANETSGEIIRHVIAQADVTLGLAGSETVIGKRPLTELVGGPVTVVVRRPLHQVRIRLDRARLAATGEELAGGFFKLPELD